MFRQIIHKVASNQPQYQPVRGMRKPIWLPPAKSKMFRVPPRTKGPPEEEIELRRLHNHYRTTMKSIRSYLHSQYNVRSAVVNAEEQIKLFEKEFEERSKINDQWNRERAAEREKRLEEYLKQEEALALQVLDEYEKKQQELLISVEETVRREKEASKDFITADNIDAAIEKALANVVDHNYALDLDGNVYRGRENHDVKEVKQ